MDKKKKKRPYEKPTFRFEAYELDQPYAYNCTAELSDMYDLFELGYFTPEMSCKRSGELIDKTPYHDSICYHSNVIAAFTS